MSASRESVGVNVPFAVDVGGTFTDLVLLDPESGEVTFAKVPTTPQAPSEGVMSAISKSGLSLAAARIFFHGTTLGMNTLLERKGARVGLITTRGFRDLLELGRLGWPMYQLQWDQPPPLVPRSLRKEVRERVRADGVVIDELDEDEVRRVIDDLLRKEVESVAVCFLHSYAFPSHERRVGEILETEYPDVDYTLSHQITQEYREWERTVTTTVNAGVNPRLRNYLDRLADDLQKDNFTGDLLVTRCDGGLMSAAEAREQSIRTLLSGPASGVMGAVALGSQIEKSNLIAVDMGGTSFDASLVLDGQPVLAPMTSFDDLPLLVPVVEITTIGAGGGSIAWIDEGGALNVGPQSAGADPGPICYGKGGTEPTFTDAALVSGLLDPDYFLGGEIAIDVESARRGIEERIAGPLGLSLSQAASGIVALIEAKMAATLEEITVGKGYDPRDFALLAYGGGGPLVASALVHRLEIPTFIVPWSPGTFSAWGMLTLDVVHDFARTKPTNLEDVDFERFQDVFVEFEGEAATVLERQGVAPGKRQMLRAIDMRYENQGHHLTVPLRNGSSKVASRDHLRELFDRQHELTYGYRTDDAVQVVTFRLRAVGTVEKPRQREIEASTAKATLKGHRKALHRESGGEYEWAIYDRDLLGAGAVIDGPALIQEASSTTLVSPRQRLEVDSFGNLIIRLQN